MKKTDSTLIGSFISNQLAPMKARQTTDGKGVQFARIEVFSGSRTFAWNG